MSDTEDEDTPEQMWKSHWIEIFNNGLPQKNVYDEDGEFGPPGSVLFTMGEGGIYDSEAMNYIFDNNPSNRIKSLLEDVPEILELRDLYIPPTAQLTQSNNEQFGSAAA